MSLFRNKRLMAGAVLCGLVLAVELVWLSISAVRLAGNSRELKGAQRRLSRLQNRAPYPSEANRNILSENLDELAYRVSELTAEMNRMPAPRNVVEPAELSAFIQEQVEGFRSDAIRAGVELPDSLEAGFTQYASGGAVAAAGDVPRLMRQLHAVGAIANVLVDAGVASIDDISRDEFEGGASREAQRRRRPNRLGGPQDAAGAHSKASEVGPGGLYLVERIGVTFQASEQAVWEVLYGLASSPQFMVVRSFSHRTQTRILEYSPRAVKRGSDTDDETLRFLQEGILRGARALSRPERIIAGTELVQVELMVDVYHFNAEESDDRRRP